MSTHHEIGCFKKLLFDFGHSIGLGQDLSGLFCFPLNFVIQKLKKLIIFSN